MGGPFRCCPPRWRSLRRETRGSRTGHHWESPAGFQRHQLVNHPISLRRPQLPATGRHSLVLVRSRETLGRPRSPVGSPICKQVPATNTTLKTGRPESPARLDVPRCCAVGRGATSRRERLTLLRRPRQCLEGPARFRTAWLLLNCLSPISTTWGDRWMRCCGGVRWVRVLRRRPMGLRRPGPPSPPRASPPSSAHQASARHSP